MKERVKQRVQAVLTALGFITKVKEKTMTNDDWSQFYTNYKAQFGITLDQYPILHIMYYIVDLQPSP